MRRENQTRDGQVSAEQDTDPRLAAQGLVKLIPPPCVVVVVVVVALLSIHFRYRRVAAGLEDLDVEQHAPLVDVLEICEHLRWAWTVVSSRIHLDFPVAELANLQVGPPS